MTRALHLDPNFIPVVFPEIEYDLLTFPGGELHPKLNPKINYSEIDRVVITHRVNNSNAIMSILTIADALRRLGVKSLDLIMPYIPYARQDRYENLGEAFTLKVFASLINSVGFDKIYVLDAHSEVSLALIDNIDHISNSYYVYKTIMDIGRLGLFLVSPDSGANKKINKLYSHLVNVDLISSLSGVIKCDKVRNVHTGKLSGFEVFMSDIKGKPCLIVDDICDGGGTFIGLAEKLKEHNAGDLYLYATHGIFSDPDKFLMLQKHFKKIYTTNSFKDLPFNLANFKQFKLQL